MSVFKKIYEIITAIQDSYSSTRNLRV